MTTVYFASAIGRDAGNGHRPLGVAESRFGRLVGAITSPKAALQHSVDQTVHLDQADHRCTIGGRGLILVDGVSVTPSWARLGMRSAHGHVGRYGDLLLVPGKHSDFDISHRT